MRRLSPTLRTRLAKISYFLCDVDGVLTDATILSGPDSESKRFNIQDGLGLVLLRKHGFKLGWFSSRPSIVTARRARELKIDFLSQKPEPKVAVIEAFLQRQKAIWEQVCYAGDDLVDLGPMRRAGVSVAVTNAVAEVKARAHYVTRARGGDGAVREIAELLLKSRGLWQKVVQHYDA